MTFAGDRQRSRDDADAKEYAALRQDLTNRGHSNLEPPEAVVT